MSYIIPPTIPDLCIDFIARFHKELQHDVDLFEDWANYYWDRFTRHLDDDMRALELKLPF